MRIDSKLISSLKQRSKKAFEVIYHEYYKLIYYVAFTITKDEQQSLDIMQDTFVRFMNHIEDYEDNGKLKQYLTSIARNLAMNALKDKHRENISLEDNQTESNSYNDNTLIGAMMMLEKCLAPQEIEIVSLKVLFDYNFREIAEELNLTIGTVQATYYKSIEVLKKYYKERGDL